LKKALVVAMVMVLGLGLAAWAGSFSGEWNSKVSFDLSAGAGSAITLAGFQSFIDVQYGVGTFTFESSTLFREAGLLGQWFEAFGTLGAFQVWSLLTFDPANALFVDFEAVVDVSIAGVEIYAGAALQDPSWNGTWTSSVYSVPTGDVGFGSLFGVIGTAGDLKVGGEIDFNVSPLIHWVWHYGVFGGVTDWTYFVCDPYDIEGAAWQSLTVIQTDCTTAFSYATFYAEYPWACADILAYLEFSCDGFTGFSIGVENVDFGLSWLNIYAFEVNFTTQSKSTGLWFDIAVADTVCFTPYIEVVTEEGSNYSITGLELNALTVSYDLAGCTIGWGQIFDHEWVRHSGWMTGYNYAPYADNWYFTPTGGITRNEGYGCAAAFGSGNDVYPNEYFGIACDSDSCCGGALSFGVHNFLMSDAGASMYGIFGWLGTYASVNVGIGSNMNVMAGMKVDYESLQSFTIGFALTW